MKSGVHVVSLVAALAASLAVGHAQLAHQGPVAEIRGVGNILHIVRNMEASIEFYRDVLEFAVHRAPRGPAEAPNAYIQVRDIIPSMYLVAPNAQNRSVEMFLATPETRLEMLDFKDLGRTGVRPRLADPGTSILRLTVRDIDRIASRVAQARADVVTPGGAPVRRDGERVLLVKDPDGYFIHLTQPAQVPSASPGAATNVMKTGLALSVENLDETSEFWRDRFGMSVSPIRALSAGDPLPVAAGLSTARGRTARATVPGTSFEIEFVEFEGADRRPQHPAVHDPGATILRLGVPDVAKLAETLRLSGVQIISTTGQPTGRLLIARIPDNLFVQFFSGPGL